MLYKRSNLLTTKMFRSPAQLECSRHLLTLLARHSRSESGLYAVLAASPSHGIRVMMRRIFTVRAVAGFGT